MQVTIHRDGRIAIQEHGEELRYADPHDPLAILGIFRAETIFEDGLTLRQLARAVRPWSSIIGQAAWMDFDAWLKELDKTHLVEAGAEDIDLACVEIYCVLDLYRNDDGSVNIFESWDFHGRHPHPVDYDGHMAEVCGLSFTPPKKFANLPLKINPVASVHDIKVWPPTGLRPILSNSVPGSYDRIELIPTFFDTVIVGLFDKISFHGSPEDTDEIADSLRQMAAKIKNGVYQPDSSEMMDETDEIENEDDLIVKVSDLYDDLDIEIDPETQQRNDVTLMLSNALDEVALPNSNLANKLGLSDVGLQEMKAGTTAHFSTEKLQEMKEIICNHKSDGA